MVGENSGFPNPAGSHPISQFCFAKLQIFRIYFIAEMQNFTFGDIQAVLIELYNYNKRQKHVDYRKMYYFPWIFTSIVSLLFIEIL